MKKIFLDTNILLDWILERDKGQYASIIFELGHKGEIELYSSFLSFANIAYILRKSPTDDLYDILNQLADMVYILPMDQTQMKKALQDKTTDFEDMLQYQCCINGECDILITNNTKHFRDFCNIPLFTSENFLLNI